MKNGFTLVELSIVLVIIGLLIGGILVAQSMMETSRVTKQINELQQFDVAARNHYTSYKTLPGDSSITSAGLGIGGDNNGTYRDFIGFIPINWMHSEAGIHFPALYRHGFIKTSYLPTSWGTGEGTRYPTVIWGKRSTIGDNTKALTPMTNLAGDLYYFLGVNYMTNHSNPTIASVSTSGILSPAQAGAIDAKIDDSLPSTGAVVASTNTRNGVAGAEYPITLDTVSACIIAGATNRYNFAQANDDTLCRLLVKASDVK